MLHLVSWTTPCHHSQESSQSRLGTAYVLLLLASLAFTSVQSRALHHQLDNRSRYTVNKSIPISESSHVFEDPGHDIDPYWYVGRGVRPIGRFGKRQIRNSNSLRQGLNNIQFLLNALLQQEALNADRAANDEDW